MKKTLLATAIAAACGLALAKLPPPDEATKAKAAETSAKNAWQAKVDAFQLCKAQDRIAAKFASKPAKAASAPVAVPVTAASGTPASTAAAAAPIAPCIDPGPFAYNPPEQKPLETSAAHSPTGTAASPPSVKQPQAEMKPAASAAKK